MIEDHRRRTSGEPARARQVRRHRLDPIEVEVPRFEDVAVALLLAPLLAADGPPAIGEVAHQRVEFAAPALGILRLGSGHRLALERCAVRTERCQRGQPRNRQDIAPAEVLVRHGEENTLEPVPP